MDNSIRDNFIAGVLVGLLFPFLRYIWSRFVLPLIDKTIKIEGSWLAEITFPDGIENKHRITLKRFGHRIRGRAICVGGWGEGFEYEIAGTFKNLVLAAEYGVVEQGRFERGSFTLMLVEGGSILRGYLAYFDNEKRRIEAAECEWRAEGVRNP